MELHIKDRLLIPSMLPEKNSFLEFNLKKSIIKKVAITEKDKEEYSISEKDNGRIEWNAQKDIETPLVADFSKEELAYMKKSCETLSEREMPDEVWAIAEKIYDAAQE